MPSVEPSSTMTHRSGNMVCAQTESMVVLMKADSFRAGVIRTYFMDCLSQRPRHRFHRIKSRGDLLIRAGRQRIVDGQDNFGVVQTVFGREFARSLFTNG